MSKEWDYRVVRRNQVGDEWLSIQEVYYDDGTGEPMAHTTDLQIEGDTITGMRTQLEKMLESLDNPVLDEQDIVDIDENEKAAREHKGTDFTPPKEVETKEVEINVVQQMFDAVNGPSDLPGDHGLEIGKEIKLEQMDIGVVKQRLLNLEIENSDLKQIILQKDKQIEDASRKI